MNKRFVVAGAAFLLLSMSSMVETQSAEGKEPAEEVAEKPIFKVFEAGEFLTEDDFGHISDALGYLNLTPQDMQYEKKHLDHRFRLPAVNAALDDPMGLPLVAEGAAGDFQGINPPTSRTLAAGKLLGLDEFAWSAEGLLKAQEAYTKLFSKSNSLLGEAWAIEGTGDKGKTAMAYLKAQKAEEELYKYQRDIVFGGKVIVHADSTEHESALDKYLNARSTERFKNVAGTLALGSVGANDISVIGAQMPSLFAEAEIAMPGTAYSEPKASILDIAAKVKISNHFVAGVRLAAILEQQAVYWTQQNRFRKIKTVTGVEGVTGNIILALEGPNGWYVIGGDGPNTYSGDNFIGIIDLGGDDVYRGRVAAGIGLPGQSAFSFVLDLGGDDEASSGHGQFGNQFFIPCNCVWA
ncbi:MAG: hypothetical protein L3J82_02410 [Planctomycetes bacterium]|nr:hypothetical protein [Planctomycetota bacterium]